MISVCPCLVYRPLIFCKRSTTARAVLQIRKLSSRFGYMFNFLSCTWMAGSCFVSCLQLSGPFTNHLITFKPFIFCFHVSTNAMSQTAYEVFLMTAYHCIVLIKINIS